MPDEPQRGAKATPANDANSGHVRRRTTRDGQTAAEREQPFTDDPHLLALEAAAAAEGPNQLPLFVPGAQGRLTPVLGGIGALEPTSSIEVARAWYRRDLEQDRRPRNTVESYSYDLSLLQEQVGPKPIDQISRNDIARFLGGAENRSTRKRRLTSIRRFFRFLIDDARVLTVDPAEGFYPHAIQLRTPVPLFPEEQERLLAAAANDEPWSLPAIWLMLRLGLSRSELLALRRDHIDLTEPDKPVVFIFYDDVTKRGKERKMAGDAVFAAIYSDYLQVKEPADTLFPHVPPAVNGMVERVRAAAGITKDVTPQTLRHTYAVERAKDGADEKQLLVLLGLADDPRNRSSVTRYIKLAAPPLE